MLHAIRIKLQTNKVNNYMTYKLANPTN